MSTGCTARRGRCAARARTPRISCRRRSPACWPSHASCATTTISATCCACCATPSSAVTGPSMRRPQATSLPEDFRAGRHARRPRDRTRRPRRVRSSSTSPPFPRALSRRARRRRRRGPQLRRGGQAPRDQGGHHHVAALSGASAGRPRDGSDPGTRHIEQPVMPSDPTTCLWTPATSARRAWARARRPGLGPETFAPLGLRERIENGRRGRPPRPPAPLGARGARGRTVLAAAVVAVVIGGGAGRQPERARRRLAGGPRARRGAPPADPPNHKLLRESVDGVRFPEWSALSSGRPSERATTR